MTKANRIEVDHLNAFEAFNTIDSKTVGLGYLMGIGSYEITKTRNGDLSIMMDTENGMIKLEASKTKVCQFRSEPLDRLVASSLCTYQRHY